uniref:Secreted protein n=1 Tax=Macrostomum lignano TaxID=282301 RepID=A0A1I8J515_9PLAT
MALLCCFGVLLPVTAMSPAQRSVRPPRYEVFYIYLHCIGIIFLLSIFASAWQQKRQHQQWRRHGHQRRFDHAAVGGLNLRLCI